MPGWYCVFAGRWWPWSSAQNRWTCLGAGHGPTLSCSIKTPWAQQVHVRRSHLSAMWNWGWQQRLHTCPFLLCSHPNALETAPSHIHFGPLLCWHTRCSSQKLSCVLYMQCLPLMLPPSRTLFWISWHLNVPWYCWKNSGTTMEVRFYSVFRKKRNTFFIPQVKLHLCTNGGRDQASRFHLYRYDPGG